MSEHSEYRDRSADTSFPQTASALEQPASSGKKFRWRLWTGATFVVLLVLLLLGCMGLPFVIQTAFFLTFGSLFFLASRTPQLTVDAGMLMMSGVAAALFLLVGILVVRELLPGATFGKRLRMTTCLLLLLFCGFLVGIGFIGAAHQVTWALTSSQPWLTSSFVSEPRNSSYSRNNQKNLLLAMHNQFDSAVNRRSPFPGVELTASGEPRMGWEARLLPMMDHQELFDQMHPDAPWDATENRKPFQTVVEVFINPSLNRRFPNDSSRFDPETGYALSNYTLNGRVCGYGTSMTLNEVGRADGLSQTIFTGEIADHLPPWGRPGNLRDPAIGLNVPWGLGSMRTDGSVNVGMVDGSVKSLSSEIDPAVLRALSTPDGGEEIPSDF